MKKNIFRAALVSIIFIVSFTNAQAASLNLTKLPLQITPLTDSLGGVHPVEVYQFNDAKSGQPGHFVLILADNGQKYSAPYPTIVENEPYTLFPAPPSTDSIDVQWSNIPPPNRNIYLPDISFPAVEEIRKCSTSPCKVYLIRDGLLELFAKYEWHLRNGYSVAFTFGRFYAARDLLSTPYEVISVIQSLKTLPSVDAKRIGLTGIGLGGFETVYPLSRGDMPLSIAAAVAQVPLVDFNAAEDYYYSELPRTLTPSLLQNAHDFSNGYFNRFYKSAGVNSTDPRWAVATNSYIAGNLKTPILLISSTDDMMVPVSQTVNLYNALKVQGKSANKVVYQNGAPPFLTRTLSDWGHGVFDKNSSAKMDFLMKVYFVNYVPPSIGTVTFRHPAEVDIVATIAAVRTELCAHPEELQNYSEIVSYMANAKLTYTSSDPRIRSGSGPEVISQVINLVWTNEGLNWTGSNVVSNLLSKQLPTVYKAAPILTLSSLLPTTIQIGVPSSVSFKGMLFVSGAVLQYRGPSTGETPLQFVSSNEMKLNITLDSHFPVGNYLVKIKNPNGQLSEELLMKVVASIVASTPSSPSAPLPSPSSTLKYFGYWGIDCGLNNTNYTNEITSFTNIAALCVKQPTDNIVSRFDLMSQNGVRPVISVQDIFFDWTVTNSGSGIDAFLRSDYAARWNTFLNTNNSLGTRVSEIAAIYIADEPTWNGVSSAELKTAADTIKASLPTVPTMIIEAYNSLSGFQVPQSVDVIGFDRYGVRNPNIDTTYKSQYATLKSRRSRSDQKIMIIKDGGWKSEVHGAVGITQTDMAEVATNYYNFANADPDVIAIGVFVWPTGQEPGWIGARDLPSTVISEHKRIGAAITRKVVAGTTSTPSTPVPLVAFKVSESIKTTAVVTVRSCASITCSRLGTQPLGSIGIVTSGPINANGYTWWKVNYSSGVDGWTVGTYLVKATPIASSANTSAIVAGSKLTRTLDLADTGPDVVLLQRFLSSYDNVYPERFVTGFFGKATWKAVIAFQKKVGLEPIGRVGILTLRKINELLP